MWRGRSSCRCRRTGLNPAVRGLLARRSAIWRPTSASGPRLKARWWYDRALSRLPRRAHWLHNWRYRATRAEAVSSRNVAYPAEPSRTTAPDTPWLRIPPSSSEPSLGFRRVERDRARQLSGRASLPVVAGLEPDTRSVCYHVFIAKCRSHPGPCRRNSSDACRAQYHHGRWPCHGRLSCQAVNS
jgi:hypothetical protein